MGLDQYMYAEINTSKDLSSLDVPEDIKKYSESDSYTETNAVLIAQWRGEHELNELMLSYWDGGEFNCEKLYIDYEILDEWGDSLNLSDYDNEVIKKCRELLGKDIAVYYTCWW